MIIESTKWSIFNLLIVFQIRYAKIYFYWINQIIFLISLCLTNIFVIYIKFISLEYNKQSVFNLLFV